MTESRANEIVLDAIRTAIRDRGEVGIQVAAYLDSKLVVDVWAGIADKDTGRAVDADTVFPIFSVTKALTALALHIQAERGLVDCEERICRYWPEFGVNGKENATIYDALTHRLGIPLMPQDATPELMCDWDWMVQQLAEMKPLFEPGTTSAYHSYTWGWVIAEIVRRTDPKQRPFSQFVQQEICEPLGIDSLWMGTPDEVAPRIARLYSWRAPNAEKLRGPLHSAAIPPAVATTQEVFGRPDVRRACLPAAGCIGNARSVVRVFALLANLGELDGVRLLSEERVRQARVPRPPCHYDPVYGTPHHGSIGGFQLSAGAGMGSHAMAPAGRKPGVFGHPGAGGSIGYADPEARLAVAITHNRMFSTTGEENPLVPITKAVHEALGVS